ncbi:nuclear transport factor 2 family protein [Olivibacter sp. SDN3]|uniref:nuclear transport factor 2 family protein n=1 Tax=Olivibacter sp. SDN3 TaxID=2764720 RepID=UPI001651211D|nr:nuclear transport factor 2 family protein [Olivibacter sp. SDN3]QNL49222.1 nuclear transport factor 2 family protein [Olivibacter sp. SDN3]
MTKEETMIREYIDAYNKFDIEKMLENLDENLRFENIANGVSNMILKNKKEFKAQAELVVSFFLERRQVISSISHRDNTYEVILDYYAKLAKDLPNGLKKNETINLQGKSIFKVSGNKIAAITDIS